MKSIISINIFLIFFSLNAFCQKTFIPDDDFEQALINLGYDDVLDDSVYTSSIDTIESFGLYIVNSLEGIEDFSELKYFSIMCVDSIDLSSNHNLK